MLASLSGGPIGVDNLAIVMAGTGNRATIERVLGTGVSVYTFVVE